MGLDKLNAKNDLSSSSKGPSSASFPYILSVLQNMNTNTQQIDAKNCPSSVQWFDFNLVLILSYFYNFSCLLLVSLFLNQLML